MKKNEDGKYESLRMFSPYKRSVGRVAKNAGNVVKNSDDFNNALQSAKEKAEKRVEIIRNPNAKDKKNEAHKDLSVLVDAMDQVGFDYNEKTVTFTPRTV